MHPLSRLEKEREELAAEYLRILQEFSQEIETATRAIARNALAEFEDSVRRQEALSSKVQQVVTAINASWESSRPQPSASHHDSGIAKQIREALDRFQRLNLRYAALLKHSGQSVALMSSLCRTYGAELPMSGVQPKQQTWSCEV